MTIDWTKPLVVAGTDRVATVKKVFKHTGHRAVEADWEGDGQPYRLFLSSDGLLETSKRCQVTNAPLTPQIGPEHIEALAEAIEAAEDEVADAREALTYKASRAFKAHYAARHAAGEQRAARLAEIRAYLESL